MLIFGLAETVGVWFICDFLHISFFFLLRLSDKGHTAFVFNVSFSCWCVRFAASIRKALFVTYSLNGCFECVLHWCWHTFCQKLCNFRVYFPCISNVLCVFCVLVFLCFGMVYSYMLVWCSSNCTAAIHGWHIARVRLRQELEYI